MGKVMPTFIKAAPQPQTNSEYSSLLKCMKKYMTRFYRCQLILSSNVILELYTTDQNIYIYIVKSKI